MSFASTQISWIELSNRLIYPLLGTVNWVEWLSLLLEFWVLLPLCWRSLYFRTRWLLQLEQWSTLSLMTSFRKHKRRKYFTSIKGLTLLLWRRSCLWCITRRHSFQIHWNVCPYLSCLIRPITLAEKLNFLIECFVICNLLTKLKCLSYLGTNYDYSLFTRYYVAITETIVTFWSTYSAEEKYQVQFCGNGNIDSYNLLHLTRSSVTQLDLRQKVHLAIIIVTCLKARKVFFFSIYFKFSILLLNLQPVDLSVFIEIQQFLLLLDVVLKLLVNVWKKVGLYRATTSRHVRLYKRSASYLCSRPLARTPIYVYFDATVQP